ncbi:hypothetical protein [Streptomyces sp. CRN 30]|uniref:hypothetical protein n=1 Tax=Streptomyces sp. CRN 30 TaxID=3075613 RepID=UPI002A820730|nr:hypothetical protein [Streptomyces sp. CRN 30]
MIAEAAEAVAVFCEVLAMWVLVGCAIAAALGALVLAGLLLAGRAVYRTVRPGRTRPAWARDRRAAHRHSRRTTYKEAA